MASSKPPELSSQQHIADFLVRVHGCGVLDQSDISDTGRCIAEDQHWAFLAATQADERLDHISFNSDEYFSFLEQGKL